jgi:triacylglycerol esterase/lipase EstA (alpha/beta hydrolase family)
VLLVHGLGADGSCFTSLESKLDAEGYATSSVSYSSHRPDVAACAEAVEQAASRLLATTRAETLDVVAHSLGGILLRWAVTHTRLRDRVGVAVTLGTPHRGTPAARLSPAGLPGFGTLIRQLRPGLPGLPGLTDGSWGPTRWVTVAGRLDWVVPPAYAGLPPSANVRNVVVPGSGHMHLTRSEVCHRIVLDELRATARPALSQPVAA